MKKLTKKALNEMLKKDYFLGNVISITEIKDKKRFVIVYPFTMVDVIYNDTCGWSCLFYGEVMYSLASGFIDLVKRLDNQYHYKND